MKVGVLGSVVGAVTVCVALAMAGPAGAALTVSGTGDSGGCSLRATIEDVNNGTAGGCGTLEGNDTTIEVPAGNYIAHQRRAESESARERDAGRRRPGEPGGDDDRRRQNEPRPRSRGQARARPSTGSR